MDDDFYKNGAVITGAIIAVVVFIGSWIYCINTYGFLLGVGLGWLPSIIAAVVIGGIIGLLWPLAIALIVLIVYKGLA